MKLVIANRNYSSWSLRAWLFMKESGLTFDEVRLNLFTPGWRDDIAGYSPAARVPVLIDDTITVWDTNAIIEYLRETRETLDWPADRAARAHARAVSGEMHSGFLAIRDELPMNIRAHRPIDPDRLSPDCRAQIKRIVGIWEDCYDSYRGPWLFGDFGIADVMFTPVAMRFASYGIRAGAHADRFVEDIRARALVREWTEEARSEKESIDFIDNLVPASKSQLTLG